MNIDICTHNRTESITFHFTMGLYSNSAKCSKMLTLDVLSNPKKRRILDLLLFTITASHTDNFTEINIDSDLHRDTII